MRNCAEVLFLMLQGIVFTLGAGYTGDGGLLVVGLGGFVGAALFALA